MGKLSLNSKLFNSIIFKPFETRAIVFKGPSGTTMGNFINTFDIFDINGAGSINMYIGNINNLSISFISDGSDWFNASTEENLSNYVIPLNAIFVIDSTSNAFALFNLGGNATNYFQGQTSIKKQNLSILIPYYIGAVTYSNNLYIFKSATTNLLGTIINPSLFNSPYEDIVNITPPNQDQLSFYFDGSEWIYSDFSPNGNNYVIPNNSIIQIQTLNITSVPVGGGAIIQKYYSGKISLKKN